MKKALFGLLAALPMLCSAQQTVFWKAAELPQTFAGSIQILGTPHNVPTPLGDAVFFDGDGDGFYLPFNFLADMKAFTLEVVFRPDSDGGPSPRFMHFGNPSGRRVMFELRRNVQRHEWYFDAHFTSTEEDGHWLTLIDSTLTHPYDKWYSLAIVAADGKMTSYVNGIQQLTGPIDFVPVVQSGLSIGYRQTRAHWLKGSIYAIRITPKALKPNGMLKLHKKLNK